MWYFFYDGAIKDFTEEQLIEKIVNIPYDLHQNHYTHLLNYLYISFEGSKKINWDKMSKQLGIDFKVESYRLREKSKLKAFFQAERGKKWIVFKRLVLQILGLRRLIHFKVYIADTEIMRLKNLYNKEE